MNLLKISLIASILALNLNANDTAQKPITLKTMGSFMFGGVVKTLPSGESFHGDHGYAQFYIPQNARNYPIVMWHGIGQSGKSYESTPSGAEGFSAILPRNDWATYIIDQPRRGRAGYTDSTGRDMWPTSSMESAVWDAFRIGVWIPKQKAKIFENVQFEKTPEAIEQFFRQQTPDTGAEPRTLEHRKFMAKTMKSLFERTGEVILMTHSNSGQYGWQTAMENPKMVKAIVAFEPGHLVFPNGEKITSVPFKNALAGELEAPQWIDKKEFLNLTKMPIVLIYGDNIATELSDVFNVEVWRISREYAKQFVATINKYGGDAKLILLPEIGIFGNTHAPFADLNNAQIAELVFAWLKEKNLDKKDAPHAGLKPYKLGTATIPLE